MTTPIGPTNQTPAGASTPISQVLGQPATAGSTGQVENPNSTMGKDTFLKLLVDQLKYQDPMNPAQGTEFVAQTAQFTTVEKLTDLADVQNQMLTAQLTLGAANLIGKSVSYNDAQGQTKTGTVTGATLGTNPTLTINGLAIPMSTVTTIGTPGLTPTTSTGEAITPVPGSHAVGPSAAPGAQPGTGPAIGTTTPAPGTTVPPGPTTVPPSPVTAPLNTAPLNTAPLAPASPTNAPTSTTGPTSAPASTPPAASPPAIGAATGAGAPSTVPTPDLTVPGASTGGTTSP